MSIHERKRNTLVCKIMTLLLLCGLLLPFFPQVNAASVIFEYTWIKDDSDLPTDNKWHDYFIAWEDLNDKNKVWFTDYHWYTSDRISNIDVGGSSWMEYKAAGVLPDSTSEYFLYEDKLGHMQIKYAGVDRDSGNDPMYYIRVELMDGGYSYFTAWEPTTKEADADKFTFQDMGDVYHIFVNRSGIDRYLTRDGEQLETTYHTSSGGGAKYRNMRVYKRGFMPKKAEGGSVDGDVVGKVDVYEYYWVNTVDELLALTSGSSEWYDVLIAWHDNDDPDAIWYTKNIWTEGGQVNYKNDYSDDRCAYWSNEQLGTGYTSSEAESFIAPDKVGHFQIRPVDWDRDNNIQGYKDAKGKSVNSPQVEVRFSIGNGKYIYLGQYNFTEDSDDLREYTIQMFVRDEDKKNGNYGYVHIFQNYAGGEDEYLARNGNRIGIQEHNYDDDDQYYLRLYVCKTVQYDAIVKSFTVGKGATYSIGKNLIVNEGVTITVEDGGVLMVDEQLLNNGSIVVNKGGTLIVNEDAYVMTYDEYGEGNIKLDGGNMIIMDGAKVLCDMGDGTLRAINGASIVNRGMLIISTALELRNNSRFANDESGMLVIGGKVTLERGTVSSLPANEVLKRVTNSEFALLCSSKSKLRNYGTMNISQYQKISLDRFNGVEYAGNIVRR